MGPDRFDTPPAIVAKMISCVKSLEGEVIADFAAGDGMLLRAAADKWPSSILVATDVDRRTVKHLHKEHPLWIVKQCDFLRATSRRRAQLKQHGCISLILLNPPFSGKGNMRWECRWKGKTLNCSQALAFVVTALNYLSEKGELVSILPVSCFKSDKDRAAWAHISQQFRVRRISENGRGSFDGCVANTLIVHLSPKARPARPKLNGTSIALSSRQKKYLISMKILRGKVQVHEARLSKGKKGWPFVHSTDLTASGIDLQGKRIQKARHLVTGPVVLMTRVGKPMSSKVIVYHRPKPIVLSDCVIALKCKTLKEANTVRNVLQRRWSLVSRAFEATCAPYITVSALADVRRQLGFDASIQGNDLRPRSIDYSPV
jgi:hypothetical protein